MKPIATLRRGALLAGSMVLLEVDVPPLVATRSMEGAIQRLYFRPVRHVVF